MILLVGLALGACPSVPYVDVAPSGRLRSPFPNPVGAPGPHTRRLAGEAYAIGEGAWQKRDRAWVPIDGVPDGTADLTHALGAFWALDGRGALWRADRVTGPWSEAHAFEPTDAPTRWAVMDTVVEQVTPRYERPTRLVGTAASLLAVGRNGATWASSNGESWTFHAGTHNWADAQPFVVDGRMYMDARVLHVWRDTRWVPLVDRGRGSRSYGVDDERVYLRPDPRVVEQGWRGSEMVCFTRDGVAVPLDRRIPVSGIRVGPWFPQSDGTALVVRTDATMRWGAAQWLRVAPDGTTTVVFEHRRPSTGDHAWPLHASSAGLVVAGTDRGAFLWDASGRAEPRWFRLQGHGAVAVDGGAYLLEGKRVHWLDLASGKSSMVHEIRTSNPHNTYLRAAARGHLWLEDDAGQVLVHVDLASGEREVVATDLGGHPVHAGPTRLFWSRSVAEPGQGVRKGLHYSAPLTGGEARQEASGPIGGLLERDGRVLRVASQGDGLALHAGDTVVGRAPDGPPIVGARFAVFGDRLVQMGRGVYTVPLTPP
jgi:hypothetical protein